MSRRSKLNNWSSPKIQLVITFHTNVMFERIICRDATNWTTEALEKFNGHNISLGSPILAHNISRHLKLNMKLSANSNGHNFWLVRMCDAHDISRRSKMNNGSSREIQMVIIFHSDVQFSRIVYQDAWNWTRRLSINSNGQKFWFGCMCQTHAISRSSKMNKRCSREI